MDIKTIKLLVEIASWFIFPFLGVLVGIVIGILYRTAKIRIVRAEGKLLPMEIGACIGFGIGLGAIMMSTLLTPGFWEGTNFTLMYIREIVGFVFYILLADIVSIAIANSRQDEISVATPE